MRMRPQPTGAVLNHAASLLQLQHTTHLHNAHARLPRQHTVPAFRYDIRLTVSEQKAQSVHCRRRGAVAAYSRALQLDDSAPPLWSNRAAAHLKLGAWASAEEDAGRALDVMRARESRWGGVLGAGGGLPKPSTLSACLLCRAFLHGMQILRF